jgi:hypothetical protein
MLGRRALVFGLLASLGTGQALAQHAAPATPGAATAPPRPTPERRRQRRQADKTVTAPEPRGQPAPTPNRDIEAPRSATEPQRARLSPTIIDPAPAQPHLRGSGFAMQAQEDRLLQKPVPGARLSVPFSY